MKFEEKLLQLRKEKELSQENLAKDLNVSRQSVSKWESGQSLPDIENLIRLSDIFKISLDDLIKEKELPKKESSPHKAFDEDPSERAAVSTLSLTFAFGALGLAWGIYSGAYVMTISGALVGFALGAILNVFKIIK